jgi:hypothetical protein
MDISVAFFNGELTAHIERRQPEYPFAWTRETKTNINFGETEFIRDAYLQLFLW